jgi:uncharacterized membrane protein
MLAVLKRFFGESREERKSDKWIFGTLLVFGIFGLAASFALTVERFHQLVDPNAQLICNFNAIFNCGTVMQTAQAKVFGFPNSLIGLMAYPVVITLAVAGLSGVRFPRQFMLAAQICFGLGLMFAYWLFFQSVYVIQVLCPWCLVVTVSTTILFAALLRYNLRENNLFLLSKKGHKKVLGWLEKDYDKFVTAGWLALMVLLVLIQFPGIF